MSWLSKHCLNTLWVGIILGTICSHKHPAKNILFYIHMFCVANYPPKTSHNFMPSNRSWLFAGAISIPSIHAYPFNINMVFYSFLCRWNSLMSRSQNKNMAFRNIQVDRFRISSLPMVSFIFARFVQVHLCISGFHWLM